MTPSPDISVIIRARDEAGSIGRCLGLVRSQEGFEAGAVEVIVVDSGSRDDTVAIAAGSGARVISIPSCAFTFGGALNLGAGVASPSSRVFVALSAHAFPLDSGWLARLAATFEDPVVACACGERFAPDGSVLAGPVRFDGAVAAAHPSWGYSNAAGAFRASLWRERPFRADLPACEDREWALHWISQGYACVLDPALLVDHDHTHDPMVSIYRRARREAVGFGAFLDMPPYGVLDLAREWWTDLRFYDSPARARLSHRRAARLLGAYVGRRRAHLPAPR
ncbi:MAG TPA: glycosyltransferase [Solirubrobacteraceae bacterium]